MRWHGPWWPLLLVLAGLLAGCATLGSPPPLPSSTPTMVPTLVGADVFRQAAAGATQSPAPLASATPAPRAAVVIPPRPVTGPSTPFRFSLEEATPTPTPIPSPTPTPSPTPRPEPTLAYAPQPAPAPPVASGPITVIILPGPGTPTPLPPAPTLPPMTPPPPLRREWRSTGGKIGLGIYPGAGQAGLQAVAQVRPAVVVLMDDEIGRAPAIKAAFPNCFIVGRKFAKLQGLERPAEQGLAFADQVAAMAAPVRNAVDAWQSYNEPVSHNAYADYAAWNVFQVAFANRLQNGYGLAAMAGNDGTASVEPYDYVRYFKEAVEASAYFGVHAYAPTVDGAFTPDALLRYQRIHQAFADARINVGPFVLTETGMTYGYRDIAQPAVSSVIRQLSDRLRQDDYVIGQAVYGIFGATGQFWSPFDLTGSSALADWGAYNSRYR